ncbi:unnamed protein product [Schistosoma curassoni]|uniref:Uncharacterized protein n=1 Tax=Schistosoma curassoni TaxID=6186 RepID=A0A183JYB7_9TREM|nr:unnamed protein product [Schistosoma curassoni]
MQNTSDPLARHYQQQPTVGENKPDSGRRRKNQKEALKVHKTHIEESTQLHHKANPHLESSKAKEKRKTNEEHITWRNGDGHGNNEQHLDRARKEGPIQYGLENAGRRTMLHWK